MPRLLRLFVIALIALVGLGIGFGWYLSSQTRPVSATPQPATHFIIPKGQAVSIIAQRLTDEGYIRNPLIFRLHLMRTGLDSKLQAGSFDLSPHMNMGEIAQELTSGTNDVWVTLLEGWRREEVADALATVELDAFDKQAFLDLSVGSEGMLFPDTYQIPREADAAHVFNLLTGTFNQKITQGLAKEIATSDQEWEDVLIMASIVEREARGYEQMREVAGILWNRLDLGMALQADATLQYIKGYDAAKKTWWPEPLAADKQLNSAFNTYRNPGLPPRPISNPGINAVRAALNPTESDNLFYIHDRSGRLHYARTLDEHNRNINQYLR